jgi:hypothetical protein
MAQADVPSLSTSAPHAVGELTGEPLSPIASTVAIRTEALRSFD